MLQLRTVVWDRKDAVRTTGLVHIATRRRLGQEKGAEIREHGERYVTRSRRYTPRGGCSALETLVVYRVDFLRDVWAKVLHETLCSMSGMSFIRGWQPHRPLANTTHPDTVRIFARFGVQITALTPARVAVHDSHNHLTLEMLQVSERYTRRQSEQSCGWMAGQVRTPHFDQRVPSLQS